MSQDPPLHVQGDGTVWQEQLQLSVHSALREHMQQQSVPLHALAALQECHAAGRTLIL